MTKTLKTLGYLLVSMALMGVANADNTAQPAAATPAVSAVATAVPSDAEAQAKQLAMKNMLHANPMPNYILIIKKQAETLKLNAEQLAKIDAWQAENNQKAAEMVKKIIAAEQALAEASMKGISHAELMQQFDAMAALRRTLADQKTKCRDHMQATLSPEQWQAVVSMQAAH